MMTLNEPLSVSDTLLLDRCRRGDHNAYGQIVERYQTLVCSVAYNQCGDFALSEDLAQEAFLAAWGKLADLRDTNRFKAWICSIVRNLTSRTAKRQNRSVTGNAAQLDAATDRSTDAAQPDEQAVSAEEGQLVWQALEVIPEAYREPMILFYREEQSVARVAEALELSQDVVKKRLSRGRRMLQQELVATVEKTLSRSKPSTSFTAVILAGLTGTLSTTAAAAASMATTTIAKSAGAGVAKASVGGLLGVPFLALLTQLPLISWLLKTALAEARSERERRLMWRYWVVNGRVILLFFGLALSSIWWQKFLPISGAALGLVVPAAMFPAFLLLQWSTYRLNKQIKQLREEEGTATPPRPLCEAAVRSVLLSKIYRIFVVSGLLVIAWPAALAIRAADWPVLGGILALSVAIGLVASRLGLRLPKYAFQSYGMSLCLIMIIGIAVTWWRHDVWTPEISDIAWFFVAMIGMSSTTVVLTSLVRKKIHGRADKFNS